MHDDACGVRDWPGRSLLTRCDTRGRALVPEAGTRYRDELPGISARASVSFSTPYALLLCASLLRAIRPSLYIPPPPVPAMNCRMPCSASGLPVVLGANRL